MDSTLKSMPTGLDISAEKALDQLMSSLPSLNAAVIATGDGFEIAATARSNSVEVAKLAAMACSISALGTVVGDEGGLGQYQNVIVEAEDGYVVIVGIPNPNFPLVLSLISGKDETLGQLIYMAKRTASQLA